MNEKLKHVFVLMFENRSFDHMLGFSSIKGTDASTGLETEIQGITNAGDLTFEFPEGSGKMFQPSTGAPFSMKFDPPHEFKNTLEQLSGNNSEYVPGKYPAITNKGFAKSYSNCDPLNPTDNMKCFRATDLPIFNQLATEFAVCDNWFSSVPGPTWPNRFFLHAGTSGGLDDSPSKKVLSFADFEEEFAFENGNIFKRLTEKKIPWLIYEGDEFSQSYALSGMHQFSDSNLRPFKKLETDLAEEDFAPKYIFIEPCYGYVLTDGGSFKCGNSQHPLDDVRRGEKLLKEVYELIRNSKHWDSSCLVVIYDEHGGFYDHVPPPPAIPPGDKIVNKDYNQNRFTFDQLGVRVPALIISPLIPKNTIDHTLYDHTSVLKSLENWLGFDHFTDRDKNANSFEHLFTLDTPRKDTPPLLISPSSYLDIKCNKWLNKIKNIFANFFSKGLRHLDISPTAQGFLHIAFLKNLHLVKGSNTQKILEYNSINNKGDALKYIEETRNKIKVYNQNAQQTKDEHLKEMNESLKN